MDRLFEERAGGCGVAVVAKVDIDYLAMLVDRSEQVASARADLDVGLIHPPAPAQRGPLRPGRFDEARGEDANSIIDRAGIFQHAACC
jgi:hypothetical protein